MTIKQALVWGQQSLAKKTSRPGLDAEVLLAFLIKQPKEFLYTYPEKTLTKNQVDKFKKLIRQRASHRPVAYLVGHKEFYGLDFYVDKRVLVPRPETEMIIDEVLKLARGKKLTIADIGTGSGCVAVTLAKKLPQATIYATDISLPALTMAKKNASRHKVKIKFLKGNLLEPLKNKKIDIVTANLPYGALKGKEKFVWNKSVHHAIRHEPNLAINGGEKGLTVIEKLLGQITDSKTKPKHILLEFDPYQKTEIKKLLKKYLPTADYLIKKDLSGFNRLLLIKN